MLCWSPMSMNIRSKMQNSLVCFAGTSRPHCNIYCKSPTVFRHTDLPPAFGPEIIKIRFLSLSSIFKGTMLLPWRLRLSSNRGWRASYHTKPSSCLKTGFPAFIERAYFAFALKKSILARKSYAPKSVGMYGRTKSVNSVSMRTISLFSSNSSSLKRLCSSTTSAGSMNEVCPLEDSSTTKPCSLRLLEEAIGMTPLPSLIVSSASGGVQPSFLETSSSFRNRFPASNSARCLFCRIEKRVSEALSAIVPSLARRRLLLLIICSSTKT